MPRYAVSHIDWFNHDLITVIVEAADWKSALMQHPVVATYDWDGRHGDTLEGYKREAFDADSMIEVTEIPT